MTDFKFSEEFIQTALNDFFSYSSVKYNIDGLYVFDWESDKLLETKSGYIYEFEIKISKADFKNDFKHKKDKHIKGQDRYVTHKRFNNAFMMNVSTSPFYPLYASLDINAKIPT